MAGKEGFLFESASEFFRLEEACVLDLENEQGILVGNRITTPHAESFVYAKSGR